MGIVKARLLERVSKLFPIIGGIDQNWPAFMYDAALDV